MLCPKPSASAKIKARAHRTEKSKHAALSLRPRHRRARRRRRARRSQSRHVEGHLPGVRRIAPRHMAAMIMWLRGYDSGKLGIITATDTAEIRGYGGKLGRYCKEHPDTSVIDASEQILSDEDHGI